MDTMTLPAFIAHLGDEVASKLFQTELRTIQSWRRRERYPRPKQAQQMVAVADGRLTMQGIYGDDSAVEESEADKDPDAGRIEPMVELP